jgi:hypothetical protein
LSCEFGLNDLVFFEFGFEPQTEVIVFHDVS